MQAENFGKLGSQGTEVSQASFSCIQSSNVNFVNSEGPNTIQIGNIIFYFNAMNKKSTYKLLEEYLGNYRTQSHEKKLNGSIISEAQEKNTIGKQLSLEKINLIHCKYVKECLQRKFTLRKSEFKTLNFYEKTQPLFKMDYFWKIQMSNLQHMDLSSSRLSSVEALNFVYMPELKRLQIHQNKISNLNTLSKLSAPNLEHLSCYDNRVLESFSLYRASFPNLKRIIIDSDRLLTDLKRERYSSGKDNIPFIETIFKFQNIFNLKELKLNFRKRIPVKPFQKTLQRINLGIKLKIKLSNQQLMKKLEKIGRIARNNDHLRFRQYLEQQVEPLLRNRERDQHFAYAVSQIRQRLQEKLHQLLQRPNRQGLGQRLYEVRQANPPNRRPRVNQPLQNYPPPVVQMQEPHQIDYHHVLGNAQNDEDPNEASNQRQIVVDVPELPHQHQAEDLQRMDEEKDNDIRDGQAIEQLDNQLGNFIDWSNQLQNYYIYQSQMQQMWPSDHDLFESKLHQLSSIHQAKNRNYRSD